VVELLEHHPWCGWIAVACLLVSAWPWLLAKRAADNFDKLARIHSKICNDLRVSEIHLAESRMERDRLRKKIGMEHPHG
jgi:hypothetical protein